MRPYRAIILPCLFPYDVTAAAMSAIHQSRDVALSFEVAPDRHNHAIAPEEKRIRVSSGSLSVRQFSQQTWQCALPFTIRPAAYSRAIADEQRRVESSCCCLSVCQLFTQPRDVTLAVVIFAMGHSCAIAPEKNCMHE